MVEWVKYSRLRWFEQLITVNEEDIVKRMKGGNKRGVVRGLTTSEMNQ